MLVHLLLKLVDIAFNLLRVLLQLVYLIVSQVHTSQMVDVLESSACIIELLSSELDIVTDVGQLLLVWVAVDLLDQCVILL